MRQAFGTGVQPGQSAQQNSQMAGEKEKMADQLKELEKQMGDTARSLAGAQNPASTKLREALSEAQQNELELRMRKGAEWIRQGQGMYTWMRESTVTMGLDRLRDQLQQAQAALGQPGGKGAGDKADVEKTLAQLENMRNKMQQLAQGSSKGQPQNGQGKGQTGKSQPGKSQPGESQSGQSQSGQGQSPGGSEPGPGQVSAGQTDGAPFGIGARGGPGPVAPHNGMEQGYRESIRDMGQLRDFIKEHPEFSKDVLGLLHAMNPAYVNDAELSARINREVIPQMEKIELELRRLLDEKNSNEVRSAGSEKVPAGYSDAIAEYFRKLSKGK
jgi:hypothetical protein